jgi:hypothetical protein
MEGIYNFINNISPEVSENLITILSKAIESDNADMGDIQLFNRHTETLHVITHIGFKPDLYFGEAKPFDSSASGRAIGIGNTIIISDIQNDNAAPSYRTMAKDAGFRAVKSIPLIGRNNNKLGVISTQFKKVKWNWDLNSLNDLNDELSAILEKLANELPDGSDGK